MPYALGAVQVQAGQTYTVPVGSAGTIGAVVCANESPYAINASISATGAPGQWIVAQTSDLIACDVSGFNGSLTFTTDNYLSNATSAPSFLLYLTAYAPGEAIRGTYPAPLVRLTNGSIGVATQLVNDTNVTGTTIIEARISGAVNSAITVDNSGNITTNGQINIGPAVGGSYSGILYEAINRVLAITSPDGGLSATGILFTTFNGSSITEALSIGAQYGNALAWIDAAGVLHAPAPVTLASGNQETGAAIVGGTDAAGAFRLNGVNFKTVLTSVPSSITLTVTSSTNIASVGAQDISKYGFAVQYQATAAAFSLWNGTYTTVGNCLLALDATARTFDHHCDACGHVALAVPFSALAIQRPDPTSTAGLSLGYSCSSCGALEAFNLALSAADEADTTPQGSGDYQTTRGAQATLIRQLMTALGLEVAA